MTWFHVGPIVAIAALAISGCLFPPGISEVCETRISPDVVVGGLEIEGHAMRKEYECGPEFYDLSHYEFTLATSDGYVYPLPPLGEGSKATFVGWVKGTIRPGEIEWALPPPDGVATWTFELRGWGDGPNHHRHDEHLPFDERPPYPSVLVSYDSPDNDREPDSLPVGVYTFTLITSNPRAIASQDGVFIENGTRQHLWGLDSQDILVYS